MSAGDFIGWSLTLVRLDPISKIFPFRWSSDTLLYSSVSLSLANLIGTSIGSGFFPDLWSFKILHNKYEGTAKPIPLDFFIVDLLIPIEGQEFQYEKIRMVNSTGTIGKMAVGDLNGDGIAEVAIPLFAENKIAFYTFT